MYAVDNGYTVADTLAIKDDGLDAVEEDIMQELFTAVCRLNMGQEVENVELSHSGRMISFSLGGDAYTVELSKDNEAK